MRSITLYAAFIFLAAATFANAQEPLTPPTDHTALVSAADRDQVEGTLKKYESAYQHMSLYELQIVWPDLPNQKKEYRKAEDLFKRGDVSDMLLSLEAKDVQVNGDNAVVHGIRHEHYLKNEKSEYYGSDLGMEPLGTQRLGPTAVRKKRSVKKTDDVTIHLHRQGDAWVISSLEENGKHH